MTPALGRRDGRDHDPDATLEVPAIGRNEGPGCDTPEAAARFLVIFLDDRGVQFAEHELCCYRHVPHPVEVLPEDAQLLEAVIADAQLTIVLTADGAEITPAGGQATVIPAHL